MSRHLRFVIASIALAALTPRNSVGQDQPRLPRLSVNAEDSKKIGNAESGVQKKSGLPVGGLQQKEVQRAFQFGAAPIPLTPKYLALRDRILKAFDHNGQIAESANGDLRVFSDQTVYMGFALLTFAGEARVMRNAGQDPTPSENVLRWLLTAFETLDFDAERERYHTNVPGFFLRDYVKDWEGLQVNSGFLGDLADEDMSIDQVVSMMMGWWAVSHWSTDDGNRNLARTQADRVLSFLLQERFMVDRPATNTSVSRGGDARGAAGFLCHIGEQITGQDYYQRGKVRLTHDNRCLTCGGSGFINVPNPNLECLACRGTGHCKIVVAGGRCEICRGTGDVKLVVESNCPACSGSGEIRVVVTDFWGNDHTLGKTRCNLCGGSGKIGGKTELGKCKVCHGSGRLPQYTKDLGRCKMCGGSGRLKGTLPKVKCPICGGSKELNLYVSVTHPILLGLEPAALVSLDAPRLEFHSLDRLRPASTAVISIRGDNRSVAQSYVRHMNLVCMAFEGAVPDAALLAAAQDSNHPWAVALRTAVTSTVCQACHGQGKLFVMAPEVIQGIDFVHHPAPPPVRHELGICRLCNGTGVAAAGGDRTGLPAGVLDDLLRLHAECPDDGPGDQSPSNNWCKDNHWVRCTDLTRGNGNNAYNGLDFLSLEILLRLAGAGGRL